MVNELLPYAKQSIDAEDISAVANALRSSIITRGPLVEQFEAQFAAYCDAKYAVAFNSGSTALLACCHAAEVNQFDRIITTPNSFVATANAGIQCRATPVFVDIESHTGNLNLEQLAYTLEQPSTQGRPIIMPVHFSGIAVDMMQLDSLIRDPEAIVIEDACHAIGSSYPNGPRVGSCAWSQMTVFSFHPAKTITTGEGGMVTTNDAELFRKLKLFRNNGIERDAAYLLGQPAPWYYEVQNSTSNYNFTEFQAALGLSQLKKVDAFIEKRRQLVSIYRKRLSKLPNIKLFTDAFDAHTGFHLCVAQIDFKACHTTREKVMATLKAQNIGTQVHYIPIYRHPYYEKICGKIAPFFPVMENYYAQTLSLPLYYDLSEDEVHRVVDQLQKALKIGVAALSR